MEQSIRVAVYCRYSSVLQEDGYSLEAQRARYEREAQAHPEWHHEFWNEPATSAYTENLAKRPTFSRLLDAVRAGEVDLVVVHKLDRWSRRLRVTLDTLDELHKHGVGFLSLEEKFDLTTPFGWMSLNMFGALAQFYSMNLAQEVMKGHTERAARGLAKGSHVRFGYRHVGSKAPDEPDVSDECDELGRPMGHWHGLQLVYAMLSAGHTPQEAADALNADGRFILDTPNRFKAGTVRPFTADGVRQMAANVYYRPFAPGDDRGTVVHRGQEYRGQHQAAVSWDVWQAARECAQGRRRGWAASGGIRTPMEEPFTAEFRGLISCAACGYRLWVLRSSEHREYDRYSCQAHTHGQTCAIDRHWARVEHVRAAWLDWLVANVHLGEHWQGQVRTEVARMAREHEAGASQADPVRLERERSDWENKLAAAIDLRFEGRITKERYEARKSECEAKLAALAGQTRGVERQTTRLLDAGRLMLDVAAVWRGASERLADPHADRGRVAELSLELQRIASILIEPNGLVVRPLGHRGYYHRHQAAEERPSSCELVSVSLREPFREVLAMVSEAVAI